MLSCYLPVQRRKTVVGRLQETGQSLARLSKQEMSAGNSVRIMAPNDQYSKCCTAVRESERNIKYFMKNTG